MSPAAKPASPPKESANPFSGADWKEIAVPLAVLAIVLAMIAPVPAFLLDTLIAVNITLSVVVLIAGMSVARPVDFSVFPTTLLLLTLFRLALNVSSSRLILLEGSTGTSAAGHVIEAFGSFVVGGNYIIGTVIFLVLIAIQYVVINHGAVRISEVTARFALDAMPGKQMSIDSDLNGGLIDEAEARRRRKELSAEAEFYGSMDGASRFTQRDAVASIMITAINIVAGFLIGVLQHGMDLPRALRTYTVLTIGDGLVTVIPALMVSVAGGMIVTRASADGKLGAEMSKQILGAAEPLMLASGVLFAMALFPGLPAIPFLALGSGLGTAGWRMKKRSRPAAEMAAPSSADRGPRSAKEDVEPLLRVEPLAVEVGLGLIRLVDGGAESALLRRIAGIRRQLASELGYLLPAVRVTDNLSLGQGEYAISLKGVEIARFNMPQGFELALRTEGQGAPPVEGISAREPAFGLPAWWIPSPAADAVRRAGFTVVDPASVLGTHLSELVRKHAHELLSRQDVKKLTDRVQEENPRAVEDLVPKLLQLSTVQRVLQNLLRERVSIRDAASILEALGEGAQITRNAVLLTEYVRQTLRRTVVQPHLAGGELLAYFLDPAIEQAVDSSIEHGEQTSQMHLAPQKIRDIIERIARQTGPPDSPATILAASPARYFLRQMLEPLPRQLHVIGHGEIPAGVKVVSLGAIQ